MKFEFSKKGFDFKVEVSGVNCTLENDGIETDANPVKRSRPGKGLVWGYEIEGGELTEKLTGKNESLIISSDSAEKAAKAVRKAKIEKEKKGILNSKIKLNYYFGDYYRVNSLYADDNILDFGNAGNIFSSNDLQDHLGDYPGVKKIYKKLDKFLRKKDKFITYKNEIIGNKIKELDGIKIEINEFDDMRGKGKYISNIIFEDFETFEKYVIEAFEEDIEAAKEKEKERQKIFQKAKKTGEKQNLKRWSRPCNDPNEACDIDNVFEYALPDGETKIERHHTW